MLLQNVLHSIFLVFLAVGLLGSYLQKKSDLKNKKKEMTEAQKVWGVYIATICLLICIVTFIH